MVRLYDMELDRRHLERFTGRLDQVSGITPFQLIDGRGAGGRALRIATGTGLDVEVFADRALDLNRASYRGQTLCWRSQNGDVAPAFCQPDDDGFLRSFFGGLLTTCGLTNFGPGGTDEWGTVGLHGRIHAAPAEELSYSESWQGDECTLEISGTMRESRVFGENVSLNRRVWTHLGSNTLWLTDTVRNDGFATWPHMILYHINAGFPLLSPGARLYVSHSDVEPRDAEARRGIEVWDQVSDPQPGFKEQVFLHRPVNCSDGRAAVALVNERLQCGEGLGLAVRFDTEQLPALQQWRMMGEGTYVMGIEPANCRIEGRLNAAREGVLPFLEAGETRTYEIEFQVLTTRAEIDVVLQLIAAANAGRDRSSA